MNNEKKHCCYGGMKTKEQCASCAAWGTHIADIAAPAAAGTIDTAIRRYQYDAKRILNMHPEGDWVWHADHLQHVAAAVAEAKREIDRVELENHRLRAEVVKLRAATAPVSAVPDDGREEFEVVARSLEWGVDPEDLEQNESGAYECDATSVMWGMWKAGRASLPPSAGAPVSAAEQADTTGAGQTTGAAPVIAEPAGGQELPALPKCAAYGVIGATGFEPNDGHRQLIGVSVGKPGLHAAGRIVRLYTEDQVTALAMRQPQGERGPLILPDGFGLFKTIEGAFEVRSLGSGENMPAPDATLTGCMPSGWAVAAKQAGKDPS